MATGSQIRAFWREEFALIALLLAFFAAIIVFALRLPFDARLFPMVIGSAGVLLCIAVLAEQWRRWRSPEAAAVDRDDPAVTASRSRYALALLSAPTFGLLLWLFGFLGASLTAMIAMPRLMGIERWSLIIAVALGTVIAMALIFPFLLGVNLPHGVAGDWLIDRLRSH